MRECEARFSRQRRFLPYSPELEPVARSSPGDTGNRALGDEPPSHASRVLKYFFIACRTPEATRERLLSVDEL